MKLTPSLGGQGKMLFGEAGGFLWASAQRAPSSHGARVEQGLVVTVSMRVMSAVDGYRYLLRTVAAGDGTRDPSTPLTRYYAEKGTPPGRWVGNGVANLGAGQLAPGDTVSEEQLALLLGTGRDPITGDPLGRAFPVFLSREERIQSRIVALDLDVGVDERAAAVTAIESEVANRGLGVEFGMNDLGVVL